MKEAELSVLGAENQFDLIGRQWMLITAGTSESLNTMTVQGRKIFKADMKECDFIDKSILSHYGEADGPRNFPRVFHIKEIFQSKNLELCS